MNDELHRHLDGELPQEDLPRDTHRDAEAWDRLLDAFRVESSGEALPPWMENRIMAEIEALPEPGLLRRGWGWFLRPRAVRVSPLMASVAVAGVAALMVLGRPEAPSQAGPQDRPGATTGAMTAGSPSGEPVVFVQFALDAPGASSVAVAGDFDGWEGRYALEDLDGDGTWTGRVPVRPGVHAYMFLVDGSDWQTDPLAERYADDGFGNRNAILAVAGPSA